MLVAGLVVLGLLFYGAGGWYFSDQLRSDGLTVKYPETNYDVRVVALNGDTITLIEKKGIKPDAELRRVGESGLEWRPNGYGRLGPAIVRSAGGITRRFSLLLGEAPRVGTNVDVNRYVFPPDPAEAFGVTKQDVRYPTPLGSMDAWVVPGSGDTWAVLVHGKGVTERETIRAMKTFIDAQYPVMSIAYRNDPGQPRDASGYYRYGATEWQDLKGAVGYALDHGAKNVVLMGFSTGAAIISSFMEKSGEAAKVAGVIFDSPNLDFGAAVSQGASKRSLPVVGLPVPESLVWVAKRFSELRFGVDFKELDYVERAGMIKVPQLLLHGTDDQTIPIEVSRRLARSSAGSVHLVEFKGAAHVGSWNVDPARYGAEITRFLGTL
jgi:alpha-beta hydrolase superfamily lysophospholipase